jgi:hypothetical protein
MKGMLWRLVATGTTLLLALTVGFSYGGMVSGDGIGWTYEVLVMTYPLVFLVGLGLWRRGIAGRPAAPLFRLGAWMAFLLSPLLLVAWAGWGVGFGEAFLEMARHLLLAAVPSALLLVAYLIFFRSVRFAWLNVGVLALATLVSAVSLARGAASLGRAFSSYGTDDLIVGIVVTALAAGLGVLNLLAARRPAERREAAVARPGPVALWWSLAALSVPFVALASFGVTARALTELGSDSSEAWGEELIVSIEAGRVDVLRSQLEGRRLGVSIPAEALVAAAERGQVDALRLLVEAGADLEAETSIHYSTALLSAARWADAATVRALLELGADPDHGGKLLAETSYVWLTPLDAAIDADNPDSLRALLEGGAATETAAGDGITPLIRAAQSGHVECVRALIEGAAALDARDGYSERTPLHHAAHWGHREVYELLLDAGADPTLTDGDGRRAAELLEASTEPAPGES